MLIKDPVAVQNSYVNIPDELKQINQWVCWRYEDIGTKRPTKVPYNAKNGNSASVVDAATWTSFDKCVEAASNYSGIGFVFSTNDPYSFIDLDDASLIND